MHVACRPSVCWAAPVDLYDFNVSPEAFTELIVRAEDLLPRSGFGSSAAKVELLLRSLPNAVNLGKLEIHGFDHCQSEAEGRHYWADDERRRLVDTLITSLPKLYHLSIVSSLGVGEKAASLLAPALLTLKRLQHLDLSHNNLGIKGADLLAPALKVLTSLQHLDLGHAGLDYRNQVEVLPNTDFLGMPGLLELRSLNLSGNNLDVNGTSSLAHVVTCNSLKYLKHLDISNNAMGPKGVARLVPALEGLADSMQHLNLGGNAMGDDGAVTLAPALRSLTRLQHLDLGENELGWKGAAALAPAVKILQSSLSHLDLGGNFCWAEEAEGVAIMAPAIKALWYLEHLDLSNTGLGFAGGAAMIAPTLGALSRLKHLNLRDSALGVDGIFALLIPGGPTVSGLCSLQHLDLGGNGVDDFEDWPAGRDGALAWAANLKEDSLRSLKYLNLGEGFTAITLEY